MTSADDASIRRWLERDFGLGGGSQGPGQLREDHKGGKNPSITVTSKKGKHCFKGKTLIAVVRQAWDIKPVKGQS